MAALFAVLLQAFAVQTHIHAYGAPNVAYEQTESSAAAFDVVHVTAADHQTACVFCEVLASAGRAALPSAPALVAVPQTAVATAVLAIAQAPRFAAHTWRSRAPPVVL